MSSLDQKIRTDNIKIWLELFLSKRNLSNPDGRPLFAYKTTKEEYAELNRILQIAHEKSMSPAFAQAFLLYSSDWWRQNYNGGSWRWTPILEGIHKVNITTTHRQQLVELGCVAWQLKVKIETGKKFIGLVAINGGLPMRLIEQAQGKLSQLLRTVLKTAVLFDLSEERIYVQVDEAAKQYLPQSFQQQLILKLLTQIVYGTVQLRKILENKVAENLVDTLNLIRPNWQHQFPIALDSSAANQLLNGLLQEATSISSSTFKTQYPFEVVRQLRFSDQGIESIELRFEMQAKCNKQQFAKVLDTEVDLLYPTMQLLLRINQKNIPIGEAILTANEVRLKKFNVDIPSIYAKSSVELIVTRYGTTIAEIDIPGGDELDDELPWIFEDKTPTANLIRVGSAKIRDESAIVIVPAKATIYNENGLPELSNNHFFSNKKIYRSPKGMTLIVYQRNRYSVECQAVDFDNGLLFWTGNKLDQLSKPELIFKGFPVLRLRKDDNSTETIPSHEIYQVINREERILDQSNITYGKCQFVWKKDKNILSKTNAVLVPPQANISLLPILKSKEYEGEVNLTNWPCEKIISTDPNITIETQNTEHNWYLHVKAAPSYHPRLLPLSILWRDGEQELILPFPGNGAVAFDRDGHELGPNSWLSVQQLEGSYIQLMSHNSRSWQIRLQLYDRNNVAYGTMDLNYGLDQEIRLYELIDPIQRLLSSIYDFDAVVKLNVFESQRLKLCLNIGRYALKIVPSSSGTIAICNANSNPSLDIQEFNSDESEQIVLQAIQLQTLENEPIILEKHFSEGVWTGKWNTSQLNNIKGVWFIYPVGSNHDLRPLSKYNPRGQAQIVVGNQKIKDAINVTEFDERIPALCNAIQDITADPAHPEWRYIERFLERFSYLPFNSLDFWSALARMPKAMAICFLFFDNFAEKATDKITRDLPFEWVLISPQDWIDALMFLKQHYQKNNSDGFKILNYELREKKELLAHHNPALSFMFSIALFKVYKVTDQSVELFINKPDVLLNLLKGGLFIGDDSQLQSLLRSSNSKNEIWPVDLQDKCIAFYRQESWLSSTKIDSALSKHQFQVIVLPFMLAKSVVEQLGNQWLSNYKLLIELRKCRDFNSEWFDAAYNAAMVYYSMDIIKND